MNSPFAQMFLALQARIATIVDTDTNEMIPYVDQNLGQLYTAERPAVVFPCALIDFQNWKFSDIAQNSQQAEGNVVIVLGFDPYSSSSNVTPDDFKEAALEFYDIEFQLYKALEGWRPAPGFGKLNRIAVESDHRRPGLRVRSITFSWGFTDFSAKTITTKTNMPPDITVE